MRELRSHTVWNIWALISGTSRKVGEKGKMKTCAQRNGIIKKTKEFNQAYVRTGTYKVLRMVMVPGIV